MVKDRSKTFTFGYPWHARMLVVVVLVVAVLVGSQHRGSPAVTIVSSGSRAEHMARDRPQEALRTQHLAFSFPSLRGNQRLRNEKGIQVLRFRFLPRLQAQGVTGSAGTSSWNLVVPTPGTPCGTCGGGVSNPGDLPT